MNIENLSKLFAVAVPPLILCSCVRLITYYDHWNIPIIDYLTPVEILISFIEAGLDIIFLIGVYFIYSLLFAGMGFLIYFLIEKIKEDKMDPKPFSKYLIWLVIGIFLTVGIIAYGYAVFQAIWIDHNVILTFLFHLILFFIVVFVVHHLFTPNENASKSEGKFFGVFSTKEAIVSFPTIYVSMTIILLSASYFYGRYQFHETETNPVPYKIVLNDNSFIAADSTVTYLGKTSNFYFLYNNTESQATIIPASEVKEVTIQQQK